ncbi:TylF/MycF/NovP-related O-methyltransferase [Nitrospinota bacterium]
MIKVLFDFFVIASFLRSNSGNQYGISKFRKLHLVLKIFRNSRLKILESSFVENLVLVDSILSIPPSQEGYVGEFGCYKGISSANLSLACSLTQRQLLVFDSFGGLPSPQKEVLQIATGKPLEYSKGDFSAGLEEVKSNINRYGCLEICDFVEGFFKDTLPLRPQNEKFAMIFEDADLPESIGDVLINAYPKLCAGGKFFSHEARDLEAAALFFDEEFWNRNLGEKAPGLVGAGIGLPLEPHQGWGADTENCIRLGMNIGSCLGFFVKR